MLSRTSVGHTSVPLLVGNASKSPTVVSQNPLSALTLGPPPIHTPTSRRVLFKRLYNLTSTPLYEQPIPCNY